MSQIDTIKEALATLENIEAMKAELVELQAEADSLRDSNAKLAIAKNKAHSAQIKAIEIEEEATAKAHEMNLSAQAMAQALIQKAQDQYEDALAGMSADIEKKLKKAIAGKDKAEAEFEAAEIRLSKLLAEINEAEGKKGALESAIAALRAAVSV